MIRTKRKSIIKHSFVEDFLVIILHWNGYFSFIEITVLKVAQKSPFLKNPNG